MGSYCIDCYKTDGLMALPCGKVLPEEMRQASVNHTSRVTVLTISDSDRWNHPHGRCLTQVYTICIHSGIGIDAIGANHGAGAPGAPVAFHNLLMYPKYIYRFNKVSILSMQSKKELQHCSGKKKKFHPILQCLTQRRLSRTEKSFLVTCSVGIFCGESNIHTEIYFTEFVVYSSEFSCIPVFQTVEK